MRWAPTVFLLVLVACSAGDGSSWTAVDDGLAPLQLRLVRAGADGSVWGAGYHAGSLTGALVHGADGTVRGIPLPDDLLSDYTFVDLELLEPGVLWIAGTAHLFRHELGAWQVHAVPEQVTDGVTAASFVSDGVGWIAGQGWDGSHIHRFDGGTFIEEPMDGDVADVSLVSLEVLADGSGVAAGARTSGDLDAVLFHRNAGRWTEVELPVGDMGGIRDVFRHDSGPEIWVVGDRILRGLPGFLEDQELTLDADFVARAGWAPDGDEAWLGGFGERPLIHWRGDEWEVVPPEHLASGDAAGRTWLVDDVHFADPQRGWVVAGFVDCGAGADCPSGSSLLRYDRGSDAQAWSARGDWALPPDVGTAGPAVAVRGLAIDLEGRVWLTGDADPGGAADWNQPQTWRRGADGTWVQQTDLDGIGLNGLTFTSSTSGWAVGSDVDGEDRHQGVVLRWDGESWVQEDVDAVTSVDWELFDVAETDAGEVVAVGRRINFPLVVTRVDGTWEMIPLDGYSGITAMLDVDVGPDGVVWVAGTSLSEAGTLEGYLVTGQARALEQVDLLGEECGAPDARYPCWSLAAVAAFEGGAVAVGESTAVRVDGDAVVATPTNMTLVDVAVDEAGEIWVLAENGWWVPDADGWSVRRHWDDQAGDGVVRRLVEATADFGLVLGQREWPDGRIEAVVLEPSR